MATKKKTTTDETTAAAPATEPAAQAMPIKPERVRYEFIIEAATAIAHSSGNEGNESIAMRRKIRGPRGWAHVPIVTADTGRHKMREASAFALLDAAGALQQPSLTESALRLLLAGGQVSGRGDASTIRLDQYHRLCDLVPTMKLFGGCADNRIVPGYLTVEDMLLICAESVGYLPAWVIEKSKEILGAVETFDTMRAHIEEEQRVRMDPTLNPRNHLLLSAGAQASVSQRLLASETAHAEDDAGERESTKSSMMPRKTEVICAGSLFSWAVEAVVYNALERDTLDVAVWSFMANAVVGGKSGTGHGKIRPLAVQEIVNGEPFGPPRVSFRLDGGVSREFLDATEQRTKPGEVFRAHVAARADEIRTFLSNVDA